MNWRREAKTKFEFALRAPGRYISAEDLVIGYDRRHVNLEMERGQKIATLANGNGKYLEYNEKSWVNKKTPRKS